MPFMAFLASYVMESHFRGAIAYHASPSTFAEDVAVFEYAFVTLLVFASL